MALRLTELFYSIQGEGIRQGKPSIFVRLWGCNLHCGFNKRTRERVEGTWECDSTSSWLHSKNKSLIVTPEELQTRINKIVIDNDLYTYGTDLVFTGGEPLLFAEELDELITEILPKFDRIYFETNGTIEPSRVFSQKNLQDYVTPVNIFDDGNRRRVHFNCSPKLSNSGVSEEDRYNKAALNEIRFDDKSCFKFVVSSADDVQEIIEILKNTRIEHHQVYLMPAGFSKKDLSITAPIVAELCKQYGWWYSDRMHINIWDTAMGV